MRHPTIEKIRQNYLTVSWISDYRLPLPAVAADCPPRRCRGLGGGTPVRQHVRRQRRCHRQRKDIRVSASHQRRYDIRVSARQQPGHQIRQDIKVSARHLPVIKNVKISKFYVDLVIAGQQQCHWRLQDIRVSAGRQQCNQRRQEIRVSAEQQLGHQKRQDIRVNALATTSQRRSEHK